jgi:hypothetical protein
MVKVDPASGSKGLTTLTLFYTLRSYARSGYILLLRTTHPVTQHHIRENSVFKSKNSYLKYVPLTTPSPVTVCSALFTVHITTDYVAFSAIIVQLQQHDHINM